MSDKKRTVTTIETHEVWIIRKTVPEISEEVEMATPQDVAQPALVSHSYEADNGSETQLEEAADIQEDSHAIGLVGRLDKTKRSSNAKTKVRESQDGTLDDRSLRDYVNRSSLRARSKA